MRHQFTRVLIAAAAAIALPALATTSQAAIFGQVSTAYTLDPGNRDIGGFVSAFEGSTLVFGQWRQGLFQNGDLGIQGGFISPEGGDLGLAVGADVKFLLMKTGRDIPFDLALDPRFGYLNVTNASVFSFGGSVVISRDYALQNGSLAPYGALNLRIENTNVDAVTVPETALRAAASDVNDDDTELRVSGIAGARWNVSDLLDILGEVVFDRDIGFTIGLNFKL